MITKTLKPNLFPVILAFITLIFLSIWQKEEILKLAQSSPLSKIFIKAEPVSDLQKIMDNQAFFDTEIVPIRQRTFIKITYIKPESPSILVLNLQMDEEGHGRNFIISDPTLDNLSWNYFEDEQFSLFQKEKKYTSIKNFLENFSPEDKILVDENIQEQFPDFNKFPIFSSQDIELENYDIIFTAYHRSYSEDDRQIWQIMTDTSQAYVEENKIFWRLIMPEIGPQNPIQLKIDINYAQPGNVVQE